MPPALRVCLHLFAVADTVAGSASALSLPVFPSPNLRASCAPSHSAVPLASQIISEEVSKKRKLIDRAKEASNGPATKKYVRRGDIESVEERERREAAEKEKRLKEERERRSASPMPGRPDTPKLKDGSARADGDDTSASDGSSLAIPNDEVIRRLRLRDEPIRLFAESDRARLARLRLLESQDVESDGQKNEFRRALEATEQRLVKEALAKQAGMEDEGAKRKAAAEDALLDAVDTTPISLELLQSDPDRNTYLVGVYYRRLVRDWAKHMDSLPDEVKRSREGKLAQTTFRQSYDYLQPFFKLVASKKLDPDVMARVTEMAYYLQQREYQKANNAYLTLSIGNAPWPIGVTMVGIHERSGREKIFASKVAHVLNDEETRKWIQSLKRCMTWCQDVRPPDDVSKRMG